MVDKGASKQRLLLGTHAANDEQNYVIIAEMILPVRDSELQSQVLEGSGSPSAPETGFGMAPGRFRPVQKINHDGDPGLVRCLGLKGCRGGEPCTVHAAEFLRDCNKDDPC